MYFPTINKKFYIFMIKNNLNFIKNIININNQKKEKFFKFRKKKSINLIFILNNLFIIKK